ncbi:MAG: DUF1854 domain-containing protein [Lachnospiraceae bacterium]|nr:DUF1854 domain-containing protein [Lachnospiraceae bacterium]
MKEEFQLSQMEQETDEMLRIRYLNKDNAVFTKTPGGFLSLKVGEEEYARVQVARMFPFMYTEGLLSIRTADERSKEIGIVEKYEDVTPETAELLREQLNLKYFTPVITRIQHIKDEYGYAYFDVDTNHGPCKFTIQMGGNAVVHLSETRILIMDIDENRFEIPDIMKLTAGERKKLDLFL